MGTESKAYLLGGGIGSLAAAAFMIRDGAFSGESIFILTVYNQYDSFVRPLQSWLAEQNVNFMVDCQVTDLERHIATNKLVVTGIHYQHSGNSKTITVENGDLVFLQNGSMTDASSLGSMTSAPPQLTKLDATSWTLWEKLAAENSGFGNPAAFNSSIAESCWESFSVTLKNPAFFDKMCKFSGNEAGTGGLVTFKDSNWLMSIVLAHQPHFMSIRYEPLRWRFINS